MTRRIHINPVTFAAVGLFVLAAVNAYALAPYVAALFMVIR